MWKLHLVNHPRIICSVIKQVGELIASRAAVYLRLGTWRRRTNEAGRGSSAMSDLLDVFFIFQKQLGGGGVTWTALDRGFHERGRG